EIKPVGAYAIKIFFDDGHNSGLFDWGFLYDLGRKQDLHWNDYLQRLAEAGHQRKVPSWRVSEDPAD
ncbi:MAG: gamma-butyrobetaine hydroxylase-like domain-containing protein, partial [Sedimenticolaceae bacterium]